MGLETLIESSIEKAEMALEDLAPALPVARKPAIQKLNYSHHAMIDLILADPTLSQNEIAERFGYTPAWISMIMTSDAWQSAFAERAMHIMDPGLKNIVDTRLKGMLAQSLDIVQQKLNRPIEKISDTLALRSVEIASRALGYGAREQTVASQVNMNIHLGDMADRLTTLLTRKRAEIDSNQALDILTQETTQ